MIKFLMILAVLLSYSLGIAGLIHLWTLVAHRWGGFGTLICVIVFYAAIISAAMTFWS